MWKYVEMCDNLHNSFLNWTRYFLSIPQNANESSKSMLAVPRWATGCCTLLSITHNTDKSWHTAGRYTHEKKLQLYKLFLLFKILPVLFHNDFLELKKKKKCKQTKTKNQSYGLLYASANVSMEIKTQSTYFLLSGSLSSSSISFLLF